MIKYPSRGVSVKELSDVFGSGAFCLLTFYADESYDDTTFCVGGWLHDAERWKVIEEKLAQRVAYESRRSVSKGLASVARFHASDCSNRRNEFVGWSNSRAVQFYKKVVEIVCKHEPDGIAWSCSLHDIKANFPHYKPKISRRVLYLLCLQKCLGEVCRIVRDKYPEERITVIHDWGFNGIAQIAFKSATRDFDKTGRLLTIAPMKWQDCIALQAADLMAYEGSKICFRHRNNISEIRKSFRKILGSGVGLSVGYLDESIFEAAKKKFSVKKMEAVVDSSYDGDAKGEAAQ